MTKPKKKISKPLKVEWLKMKPFDQYFKEIYPTKALRKKADARYKKMKEKYAVYQCLALATFIHKIGYGDIDERFAGELAKKILKKYHITLK